MKLSFISLIFLTFCFCIFFIVTIIVYTYKYTLATNSKISYKLVDNNNKILDKECDVYNDYCKLVDEYNDYNNIHHQFINYDNAAKIGQYTMYYKKNNTDSYIISNISPIIPLSIISTVLFISIIVIYFMYK